MFIGKLQRLNTRWRLAEAGNMCHVAWLLVISGFKEPPSIAGYQDYIDLNGQYPFDQLAAVRKFNEEYGIEDPIFDRPHERLQNMLGTEHQFARTGQMSLSEMRLYTRRRHEANIHQDEIQDQNGGNPGWDLDGGMALFLLISPRAPQGFPGYNQLFDEWSYM